MPVSLAEHELELRAQFGAHAPFESLLAIAQPVEVAEGQALYDPGQPATALFYVVSGKIRVNGHAVEQGLVGFAELVCGRPGATDAVALMPSRLLRIERSDYRDYLEDNFEIVYRAIVRIANALVANRDLDTNLESVPQPSFREVEMPIVDRLFMFTRMPVFRDAPIQALANLAQQTAEVRFAPGDEIIAAGAEPRVISFLVEGTADALGPGGTRATRSPRDLLADVEELATAPRRSSIRCSTPALVLQVQREDLIDLLEQHFELTMSVLRYIVEKQEEVARG